MAEFLYATSHLAGDFPNAPNVVGNTPGTWAGDLNSNANYTSRWAIGDPVDPLTGGATQTIRVAARKGTNPANPSIALNLYENGVLVQSLVADTSITSTTGQTVVGTFTDAAITNRANVEIEVVQTGQGGNPNTRNSAQISHIEWEADVTAGATFNGSGSAALTLSASGTGNFTVPTFNGQGSASLTLTASGTGNHDPPQFNGTASASMAFSASATGQFAPPGFNGQGSASLAFSASGTGQAEYSGTASASLTLTATGTGHGVYYGTASASMEFGASGQGNSGAPAFFGQGSATLTLTASGQGTHDPPQFNGAGSADLALTATGTGQFVPVGSNGQGSASLEFTASGTGSYAPAVYFGSGSAVLVFTATASSGLEDAAELVTIMGRFDTRVSGEFGTIVRGKI